MEWLTYWITYRKEDLEKLRWAGFTDAQIIRFCQLRKRYGRDEQDRLLLDRCRLEFVR